MSVSVSGPDCCGADAYVGADTGLSNPVRREATFTVPSRQRLVLAAYISVRPQQKIRFTINMSGSVRGGTEDTGTRGSGVIVTNPPSTPVEPPFEVCTDLGLEGVTVVLSRDLRSVRIRGVVRNFSPRPFVGNPYVRGRRMQWVEIVEIQGPGETPRLVRQMPFTEIEANGSLPFVTTHPTTSRDARQYEVRILYSPVNSTDRTTTNDDCNGANNVFRSRPILPDVETLPKSL